MKRAMIIVTICLITGVSVLTMLVLFLGQPSTTLADSGIRYVALDGSDATNCDTVNSRCQTIQHAVDVANEGDIIKVAAGVYNGVQGRPSIDGYHGSAIVTQTVYISTSITIRGGYTTTNAFAEPPTDVTTLDPQGYGRAMFIIPETIVTLENLQLVGGNAAGFGGGGAPSYQDSGGGLYADRASTSISNCLFANNFGEQAGGLYINRNQLILQNSIITANVATASNAGGLSIYSLMTSTISHNKISSNIAALIGGGLYVAYGDSATVLSDNMIVDNQSGSKGGGIYINSNITIINNQVINNSSGFNGGGLYVNGRSPLIAFNTFTGNNAAFYGGGVMLSGDSAIFHANSIISNTSKDGGGLMINQSEGVLENNIIAQNQVESGENGAGIYIWGGMPHLVHTTIAQNSGGDGSGIYLRDNSGDPALGRAVLTNTILVSQTVGLYADISTTATFDGVLWHGNSVANVDGSGLVTISNAYNGSPLFINPNNWDYHIEVNSTAINKGITTETNSDIDGDLRLGIPDLGADEKIWHNYLPIISRF